jgi:hypothetical protein
MSKVAVGSRSEGLNRSQLVMVILATCVVILGFLVKLDRAPSFGEMVLDPVRLMVPVMILALSGLRKKLGVTRQFAMMGIACVGLTMLSEVFRLSFGAFLLVPAFAIYVWMLGHSWKNRGIDSSWAGLALCLMLAPVF